MFEAAAIRPLAAALAALVAVALGGCDLDGFAKANEPGAGGGYDDTQPGAELQCAVAADCAPAASTCCECPTFAVPIASGFDDGCAGVDCEPAGCPLTEPACDAGACQLVCSPVVTQMVCEYGFVRDAFGCLTDVCAGPDDAGGAPLCGGDQDCVEVPADCCGCVLGGSDTAVLASEEEAYLASLSCPPDPACPGVDACDPAAVPRCLGGRCELTAQTPDEPGSTLCGTTDQPTCPEGQVCVLNDHDALDASQLGVGSCREP